MNYAWITGLLSNMPLKKKMKHNISGLCNQPKAPLADTGGESQQQSNDKMDDSNDDNDE